MKRWKQQKVRLVKGVICKRCKICLKLIPIEKMRWHSKGVLGSMCKKCDSARKKVPQKPKSMRVEIIAIPGCAAMTGTELARGMVDNERVVRVQLEHTGNIVEFPEAQVFAI